MQAQRTSWAVIPTQKPARCCQTPQQAQMEARRLGTLLLYGGAWTALMRIIDYNLINVSGCSRSLPE